jgi:hypothetical protein
VVGYAADRAPLTTTPQAGRIARAASAIRRTRRATISRGGA